jgi:rhodanese-related sulfurtransferase
MSNSLIILLILFAAYILFSVMKSRKTGTKLRKALKSGALVIDVRSPQEYSGGHFSTAINIPHDRIERRLGELGADKKRPVVLYCYAGSRSAVAERILRANGFDSVINARNLDNLRRFDPSNQK